MKVCMLTTFDNSFDPFVNYDSWFACDLDLSRKQNRLDCCSYLSRIARTSDQMTDEENAIEIERAIDEIIKYDFMNIYKKVTINTTEDTQKA